MIVKENITTHFRTQDIPPGPVGKNNETLHSVVVPDKYTSSMKI